VLHHLVPAVSVNIISAEQKYADLRSRWAVTCWHLFDAVQLECPVDLLLLQTTPVQLAHVIRAPHHAVVRYSPVVFLIIRVSIVKLS
jgi:hypothetical protein